MNQPGEVTGEKRKQMNLIQASSMETKAFNVTRIKKKEKEISRENNQKLLYHYWSKSEKNK